MNDQDKQLIDELNGIMKEFMQDLDAKLREKQTEIDQLKTRVTDLETKLNARGRKSGSQTVKGKSPVQPTQLNSRPSNNTNPTSGLAPTPSQPVISPSQQAKSYSGILGQIQSSPSFQHHKNTKAQYLLQNVAEQYPESVTESFTYIHLWLILLLKHLELDNSNVEFKNKVKDNFDEVITEYSISHSCKPSFLNEFIQWIDRQQSANQSAFRNIYLIGGVYSTHVRIKSLIEVIKTIIPSSVPERNSSS